MQDHAQAVQTEMLSWLESGLGDDEAELTALDDYQAVADVDPLTALEHLRELPSERLFGIAIALLASARIEQERYAELANSLADPDFRRNLEDVAQDPRVAEDAPAERIQWARIRHETGPSAYDRLVGYRETGKR